MADRNKEIYILLAILAVAVFFRFYNLDSLPPGLHHDEAMNGNDVVQAMDSSTYPQIFYPNNNGREGLFIDIQGLFIKIFGRAPWVLRMVSAIFGVLTVWGLYFLTKELYNHNIAALSAFFLAISFWHVNFSRIGFRAIMLPLVLVFEFYFLLLAFRSGKIKYFIITGIFAGLGLYTYISYRISLLIVMLVFMHYWFRVKKPDSDSEYKHEKKLIFKRLGVVVATAITVALPLLIFFFNHPSQFIGHSGTDLSIFGRTQPLYAFLSNTLKTFGMFNFSGDFIWTHNISRSPELFWPIGILFVTGFVKELVSWLKTKHANFLPTYTLLFSWFFVMLLPGFLSTPAPHALRTIGVIPVVMIFAGRGLWWFYEKLHHWKHLWLREAMLVVFLISLALVEFWKYQVVWGQNIQVQDAFSQSHLNIVNFIKILPKDVPKYVVVNVVGVPVPIPGDPIGRSVPAPAQTVMFLTDTFSYQKQIKKKIFYLTADEFNNIGPDQQNTVLIYWKSETAGNKKTYSPVILPNLSGPKISSPKKIFILLKDPK